MFSTIFGPKPSAGPHARLSRPVGDDEFLCGVQAVRQRIAFGVRPIAGPDIVGAAAQQQIEGLAVRGEDRLADGWIAMRDGPAAVGIVAVFVGAATSLDHAIERHVFEDFDFAHMAPSRG